MSAPHHIRLVAHPTRRAPGHTDWPGDPSLPVPSLQELVTAANTNRPSGITWLSGGEPTLRPDLPALIRALADDGHTVGLDTDGLALARPGPAKVLKDAGLTHLRLPLHSLAPEAHDWIEGTQGAAKRVRSAARVAQAIGLSLCAHVLVTRSTTDHLIDTVRVLAAIGARRIHLRRPRCRGAAGSAFITVSPRLGLSEPYLEAAIARGRDNNVVMRLDGFPRCAAPRARPAAFAHDRELWVVPESLADQLDLVDTFAPGCGPCSAICPGAPADYVARFGRLELDDPGMSPSARPQPIPPEFGQTPAQPPTRAGRSPATRLRYAVRQAATPDLGGDPMAGMSANTVQPSTARLPFETSARDLKIEMVRLAQTGVKHVIIDETEALARPDAHALLRELVRLGIPRLTVAGDLRTLGGRSKRSLKRLVGVHEWVVEIWSPEPQAHDALAGDGDHKTVLAAGHALATATSAELSVRGILPARPTSLDCWTHAWSHLPGTPAFRFEGAPEAAWTTATIPAKLVAAVDAALQRVGMALEQQPPSA